MKKIFLTAMAVFALSSMNAQEDEIRFGAKAGLNLSTFSGDAVNVKMRPALHLGVLVEIPISDVLAFQPELLYSMQGTKDSEIDGLSQRNDYLDIPLMFKYYAAKGFSLQGGPEVAILLSSKIVLDDENVGTEDLYNGLDIGFNLGLGYQLESGLFFDGRYNLGLVNIVKDAPDNIKVTNSVIQLSVGYKF